MWRVDVTPRGYELDSEGKDVLANAKDLRIQGLERIRTGWIFWLPEQTEEIQVRLLAESLLADPIEHHYLVSSPEKRVPGLHPEARWEVEVRNKPGVTDTTAENLQRGAEDLGVMLADKPQTGRTYWLFGKITESEVKRLASGLLANGIVQDYEIKKRMNGS